MSEENNEQPSQELAKEVVIDGVVYFFMPIDVAIKYSDKIKSGFFIPLSEEKRVRIEFGEDDLKGKMVNYKEKGLANILFAKEDYFLFLSSIKRGLTGFFMKDDELASKTLSQQQILMLVSKAVKYIGLDDELVAAGEENANKVLNWVKTAPSINQYFKPFITTNQDEHLKNLFVGFIGIGLVRALSWPPQIYEKIMQAALFGDFTLSDKDIMQVILANGDRSKWSKSYHIHPTEATRLLGRLKNAFSREVLRAIEQHHELPDGSGFPNGLKGLSIDQMSAMLIVARHYVNKLIETNFAYDDRKGFIDEMLSVHFDFPNFQQPCKSLYIVMGIEVPQK
ncbi:MAG: hypothetical protein COW00_16630 [Bdellovibrio sp. CG12_big_fil_rev_8_21_14_0_65_39_13]|nr:MAG: hypothetical protein COW78_09920 [Bdellovibrio sp. CG22_combo_CG10-13_8_21_14_all_39_27]PIQ58234.1 MAG: hypothetical protein COW00_16630 [Bdellovibrio sp. CG12_big_fil_rev_8_21_14_0_65_39_13]PIR36643.1 MAG: hypothetical protein COV37_02150 [Bdellovibrio sp. CG11_big_fil_rev_8_21_14_0_20_39_38]PJB53388.1 MAG: hypothetical protein CO099_07500 [Bdellovibrio sp. CG_4_9_14_3_um_filter_39_7]